MKKTEYEWTVHGDAANQGHYHYKRVVHPVQLQVDCRKPWNTAFHTRLPEQRSTNPGSQQTCSNSSGKETGHTRRWRSQDDRNWKMKSENSDYETQCKLRWTYWNYLNDSFSERDSTQADKEMKNKHLIYIKHQWMSNEGVSPVKKYGQPLSSIRPTGWTIESAVPVSVRQWQTVHGRQVLPEDRDEQCYISWHSLIDHIQINEASMKKLLLNLDPHKASGSDKICPGILKELADEISPMLTVIF